MQRQIPPSIQVLKGGIKIKNKNNFMLRVIRAASFSRKPLIPPAKPQAASRKLKLGLIKKNSRPYFYNLAKISKLRKNKLKKINNYIAFFTIFFTWTVAGHYEGFCGKFFLASFAILLAIILKKGYPPHCICPSSFL